MASVNYQINEEEDQTIRKDAEQRMGEYGYSWKRVLILVLLTFGAALGSLALSNSFNGNKSLVRASRVNLGANSIYGGESSSDSHESIPSSSFDGSEEVPSDPSSEHGDGSEEVPSDPSSEHGDGSEEDPSEQGYDDPSDHDDHQEGGDDESNEHSGSNESPKDYSTEAVKRTLLNFKSFLGL
jgi:hypothetical protein